MTTNTVNSAELWIVEARNNGYMGTLCVSAPRYWPRAVNIIEDRDQ